MHQWDKGPLATRRRLLELAWSVRQMEWLVNCRRPGQLLADDGRILGIGMFPTP